MQPADAAASSFLLSGQLCRTLQQVVDSLTGDAARLVKAAEQHCAPDPDAKEGKPFNWGFPVSQAGDQAGPVRPSTAAPSDSTTQRPRRQLSIQQNWQPKSADHGAELAQQKQARPLTAINVSEARAVGRGRHRRQYDNRSHHEAVPPNKMPEEILRQAREDYIREKNRVRDKRLQELTQTDSAKEAA